MFHKQYLLPALLSTGLAFSLFSCGGGDETETVTVPTEGLITTVQEVAPDDFKIASEVPVANPADSRVIVDYYAAEVPNDTFTLDEAKIIAQVSGDSKEGQATQRARSGYFGFLWFGRMGGFSPSAGAYVNNSAYSQASNTAGSRLNSTARTTTRTRSGFGGGKSTRSFGG